MPTCTCGYSDPALPAGSPYTFSNFYTRSATVNTTGNLVNSAFPTAKKVAEIDLQTNAGIFSLTLSSSILNPVVGTAGLFAGLADADTVSINELTRLFLSHVSSQNSIVGVPNPSARSNAVQMGQNTYYRVNQGQKIAIYAASPNDVSVLLSAVLTVFWIPLS